MKIGILGCGYVGSAAARHWKEKGHQVVATTRNPARVNGLRQIADEVIVLSDKTWPYLMETIDVLLISVAPDDSTTYEETYLETAKKVVGYPSESLKTILYTSSTSIYGEHQGEWVDEETAVSPLDLNGQILLQTEASLLSGKRKCVIFRLGEIIGPGREIETRLQNNKEKIFPGTGSNYTNLTPLNDIIRAFDFALENNLEGVFNLCNDLHIPRRELYEQICKKHNLPPIKWDSTQQPRHGGNKRVSSEKIKKLGF